MSELEQQKLARLFNSKMVIWWAPDEDTCRQIVSVAMRKVEMGLCANFSGGQYVALDGCDPSDFILGNRPNNSFSDASRCGLQCDTCNRAAGGLHTDKPPVNTDVLVVLKTGQIRVGQWNGTCWHVHSDGLEHFLFSVNAWLPTPEIKDFYSVSA